MKVKKIEQAKDGVINYSGLFLLVNLLKKSGLDKRLKRHGKKYCASQYQECRSWRMDVYCGRNWKTYFQEKF